MLRPPILVTLGGRLVSPQTINVINMINISPVLHDKHFPFLSTFAQNALQSKGNVNQMVVSCLMEGVGVGVSKSPEINMINMINISLF